MAQIQYPRPDADKNDAPPAFVLGALTVVFAVGGLLSALEVLLVGEELSTLGDRLYRGDLRWIETRLGIGIGLTGLVVLLASAFRFVAGVRVMVGRSWGLPMSLFFAPLFFAVDLACFAWLPLLVSAVAFDLVCPFFLLRRRAS